ncbi:MAG: hypothetical protein LQ345_006698 [Seirophora villosa]|nr:MAG: hypothetical protein LQ345_006698 [Seirophora villosa]
MAEESLNEPLEEELERLIDDVLDWQYTHGSLLKLPPDTGAVVARPIGVALFPSPFRKALFEQAICLQRLYNKLYIAIARDELWLSLILRNLLDSDSLVATLWTIHERVKADRRQAQPLSMTLFRSDYMMHVPHGTDGQSLPPQLKQVELNTFSLAGAVHSAKASRMHEHFNDIGSHEAHRPPYSYDIFPPSHAPRSIVHALETAHARYGSKAKCPSAQRTAIIMLVQPNNVNVCDERPIEEMLWYGDVPNFRIEFGQAVLDATSLSPSGELLLRRPRKGEEVFFEITVVYYRAGYDAEEYNPAGIAARLQLEKSRAIKCPSIIMQIAGSKKVQQELATPGAVERFLPPQEATRIRETFMRMYPLDEFETGARGRELALDPATARNHVLKPSMEGGAHNIHGSAIPDYLRSIPQSSWSEYILMQKIEPPSDIHNSLISFRGLHSGRVVSELGVYGMCIWDEDEVEEEGLLKVKHMGHDCFSFKSKASGVDEMSVVKGYGHFDSPWLV